MKEDEYTKSLAKNQVNVIVHMRDIRKKVLPKFIKLWLVFTSDGVGVGVVSGVVRALMTW